jgi:hypothetical protein
MVLEVMVVLVMVLDKDACQALTLVLWGLKNPHLLTPVWIRISDVGL